MTPRLLLLAVLVVVAALAVIASFWHRTDTGELVGVRTVAPTTSSSTTATTTTTPPPPTTAPVTTTVATAAPRVHTASVSRPRSTDMVGVQCGGDLPPCYVLKRESGGDPHIWNGRCYMPTGSYGQCGRSSASGLWQFLRSTWAGFAGYVNAADAPVEVQNEKARLVWAGGRGCHHWNACA